MGGGPIGLGLVTGGRSALELGTGGVPGLVGLCVGVPGGDEFLLGLFPYLLTERLGLFQCALLHLGTELACRLAHGLGIFELPVGVLAVDHGTREHGAHGLILLCQGHGQHRADIGSTSAEFRVAILV